DVFTNYGHYMPRTHCLVDEAGNPDWPWIIGLVVLTLGVIGAYLRIYVFWMMTYSAQDKRDRNRKMFELANIFFWCAICGYAMSILMFAWPAYRLLAIFLVFLNAWSWKFVFSDLGEFKISLQAKTYQRRLAESLRERNQELERLVASRTRDAERARLEAEAANDAKSAFLATMSHEIRTPMTAILGFTDLLQDEDLDDDRRTEALGTISRNGAHLLSLINDVLDLSKIESGRIEFEHLEYAPASLLLDVRDLLQGAATDKGLALDLEVDGPVPALARGDPTRLRQILVNLVSNAIKFTERGSITVRCRYDDGALLYEVRDTGTGIPPDKFDLIFEPFRQADDSTSRR
ncbi:MAG: hypothetical protein KDA28_00795, partial [Phycisphaerales bacterium]|nr:hypothetical protein [Phycisphaerales bacterium]